MSANLFEAGATWLNDRMAQFGRHPVTLRRGSQATATRAGVGASVHQGDNATGGLVTWASVDFLFTRANYAFGGVRSDPERGDVIESDHTGKLVQYEVINPVGDDLWTNSDEFEKAIRVHSQAISVNG